MFLVISTLVDICAQLRTSIDNIQLSFGQRNSFRFRILLQKVLRRSAVAAGRSRNRNLKKTTVKSKISCY